MGVARLGDGPGKPVGCSSAARRSWLNGSVAIRPNSTCPPVGTTTTVPEPAHTIVPISAQQLSLVSGGRARDAESDAARQLCQELVVSLSLCCAFSRHEHGGVAHDERP